MSAVYDEVEIEDMIYDEVEQIYTYPCPCGDRFIISLEELLDGEDIAPCPSCTLRIRVIFDEESLPALKESTTDQEANKESITEESKAIQDAEIGLSTVSIGDDTSKKTLTGENVVAAENDEVLIHENIDLHDETRINLIENDS